jgi:hypothetical protein
MALQGFKFLTYDSLSLIFVFYSFGETGVVLGYQVSSRTISCPLGFVPLRRSTLIPKTEISYILAGRVSPIRLLNII